MYITTKLKCHNLHIIKHAYKSDFLSKLCSSAVQVRETSARRRTATIMTENGHSSQRYNCWTPTGGRQSAAVPDSQFTGSEEKIVHRQWNRWEGRQRTVVLPLVSAVSRRQRLKHTSTRWLPFHTADLDFFHPAVPTWNPLLLHLNAATASDSSHLLHAGWLVRV